MCFLLTFPHSTHPLKEARMQVVHDAAQSTPMYHLYHSRQAVNFTSVTASS
jgi:hypothetical protein